MYVCLDEFAKREAQTPVLYATLYFIQFIQFLVVVSRMEGDGKFTDTDGQVWSGTFRYKAAPGLRFQVTA